MDNLSFSFPVESFRKLSSPVKSASEESATTSYVAVCNVKHLPTDIPTEATNPRSQSLKHQVAKEIITSFQTDPNFWLLNRGIVISAGSVSFNNATNKVTMHLTDLEKHGNVDGGHTYKVINTYKNTLGKEDGVIDEQFVRLEIITGTEDFFDTLARARNTSKQVDEKSIAELRNKFEILKAGLKGCAFLDRISFKEFEEEDKDIDVKEVVAIASMFNRHRYGEKTQPVVTYSGRQTCLHNYLSDLEDASSTNATSEYEKMSSILPEIFDLHSHIQLNMQKAYGSKNYYKTKGVLQPKFKDGTPKELYTLFTRQQLDCETPKGFIYPILASFRALVEEKNGKYCWAYNPRDLFDELGTELVQATVERSRTLGNNPQSAGKDSGLWAALFDKVQNHMLRQKLAALQSSQNA